MALSILEPAGQTAAGAKARTALEDPEDLRVLAQVLDAQKTIQHRKRAIEVLESLVGKNLANAEDRFLLARLYEISGDWPKAREEYRDLNLRTKNPRDLETLNRRPLYLAQFVSSLLRNHKAGDDQDLTEAQDLVDELKQLQPDAARHPRSPGGSLSGSQPTRQGCGTDPNLCQTTRPGAHRDEKPGGVG